MNVAQAMAANLSVSPAAVSPRAVRSTKVVATIGPASSTPEVLSAMVAAGMDVARVNFSHVVDRGEVAAQVDAIRAAAAAHGRQVAILGDLCGPKMRLRNVPPGGVPVAPGDRFLLYPVGVTPPEGAPFPAFAASVPTLCEDCRPGERVLIADGRIVGEVDTVSATAVTVTVRTGGLIEDRKGVNLPDTALRAAALTPKDVDDVAAGVAAGIDVFALSFVRCAGDVAELRALLPEGTPVVAKVERPEALENFEGICDAADGVMVARGDLGVEVGWEVLPGLQMDLIAAAADRGKLSIVATEMLESMTHSPRPTRAEVSDVATAVMEGASAVMLSAETATGADPARVVATMARILAGIESHRRYWMRNENQVLGVKEQSRPAAIAAAATRLARDVDAVGIAAIANTGAAARLVSAARPCHPVVALCSSERLARSLALWWGVSTAYIGPDKLSDDELRAAVRAVIGDRSGPVVVVSGAHGGASSDRVRIIDL